MCYPVRSKSKSADGAALTTCDSRATRRHTHKMLTHMATKRKPQIPTKLDTDFNATLERIADTGPAEVKRGIAKGAQDQRVRLAQPDEGRHPLLIYSTPQGKKVGLPYRNQTLWATQDQMANMFGVDRTSINKHLTNIYSEGELDRAATCEESSQVQDEGGRSVRRSRPVYNLNAMISVGYRVGSKQGTMFRIWATDILVQILTKGFYIDVERLKAADADDRVTEVRKILQDIRSEQAHVHRELQRICAQCQDYDPKSTAWHTFFKNTSAAIFYAAAQATPAEIVMTRADAGADNMGLFTWPRSEILKEDVTVGKNYLRQPELDDLNRFTSLLLDFMIDHAENGRLVTMAQASARIAEVTKFTGRKVLKGGGTVLRKDADAHAHAQYAIFDSRRKELRRLRMDKLYDEASDGPGEKDI
jgi:hypothetical protein